MRKEIVVVMMIIVVVVVVVVVEWVVVWRVEWMVLMVLKLVYEWEHVGVDRHERLDNQEIPLQSNQTDQRSWFAKKEDQTVQALCAQPLEKKPSKRTMSN